MVENYIGKALKIILMNPKLILSMGFLSFLQACFSSENDPALFGKEAPVKEVTLSNNLPMDDYFFPMKTPGRMITGGQRFLDSKDEMPISVYDINSGKLIWQAKPALIKEFRGDTVVALTPRKLTYLQVSDGKEITSFDLPPTLLEYASTSVVANGMVITVLSQYDKLTKPAASATKKETDERFMPGVTCWDIQKGSISWQKKADSTSGIVYNYPRVVGGKVFLVAMPAQKSSPQTYEWIEPRTGKTITAGKTEGYYTIDGENWYEITSTAIRKLKIPTGEVIWSYESDFGSEPRISVRAEQLYLSTPINKTDSEISILQESTGKPLIEKHPLKNARKYVVDAYLHGRTLFINASRYESNFVSGTSFCYLVAYDLDKEQFLWRTSSVGAKAMQGKALANLLPYIIDKLIIK